MQPTMCSRCGKNVAVIFITKLEGGTSKNEGLCLKCAREMGIKPIDDMMKNCLLYTSPSPRDRG